MTPDRVMLLIDADNVSVDVMEQAVALLIEKYGALHVRRAYCTAESAVKHQSVFKRLLIKPMVNLATGKNSTDIALAVDAIYLVLAGRPEVVAIASSDSDFAPLVSRLREQGCRVVGLGQDGKTGDETQAVYDEFTVLTHRKAGRATTTVAASGAPRGAARKPAPALKPAQAADAALEAAPRQPAAKPRSRAQARAASPVAPAGTTSPALPKDLPAAHTPAAASTTPAGRTALRKAPVKTAASTRADTRSAAAAQTPRAPALPLAVSQILEQLPELARGNRVELRVASARLREAKLLSRSGSSTRLFAQFGDHFELLPEGQPNHVRLRAAAA